MTTATSIRKYVYEDSIAPGGCPKERVITRVWTAVDNQGKQYERGADYFRGGHDPAGLDAPPDERGGRLPWLVRRAGLRRFRRLWWFRWLRSFRSFFFAVVTNGTCPGAIVRTWTATDDCGNEATVTQRVILAKGCVNSHGFWKNHPAAWVTPLGPVTGDRARVARVTR